jgi:tetratricopeptide (TPR) repeat protein
MSRLADRLMGMDRGMSRREGLGRMPVLTASADAASPRWRPGIVLVIVVIGVLISVTTLMLRARSVALEGAVAITPKAGLRVSPAGQLPSGGEPNQRFVALSTDADGWNALGVVLARQGERARGADAFGRALRLNPVHVEAHRNLAVLLDRQGRFREAAAHYRAFLTLSTESHPARDEVRRRLAEMSVVDSSASKPE